MSSNNDHKYLGAFNSNKMDKGSPIKAGLPYMPSELQRFARFPKPLPSYEEVRATIKNPPRNLRPKPNKYPDQICIMMPLL